MSTTAPKMMPPGLGIMVQGDKVPKARPWTNRRIVVKRGCVMNIDRIACERPCPCSYYYHNRLCENVCPSCRLVTPGRSMVCFNAARLPVPSSGNGMGVKRSPCKVDISRRDKTVDTDSATGSRIHRQLSFVWRMEGCAADGH